MAEPRLDLAGYSFRNPQLLETALTHRSADAENNERLEFLGDAVVGLAVAEELLKRWPAENREGWLTQTRARVVSRSGLAKAARELDLGSSLRMATGEQQTGGAEKDRLLCGVYEALVGAIFLDGGYHPAREFCRQTLSNVVETATSAEIKDPKNLLQERAQAVGASLPSYRVTDTQGADHRPLFEVRVEVGCIAATGTGGTKKKAERAAAKAALEALARHPENLIP